MLNQEKVFDMMYELLELHDQMNLSTFTSMSMCFLCATLQALDQAPPLVRQQVNQAVLHFVETVTREGDDYGEALKILERLGMDVPVSVEAHAIYAELTQN